MKIDHHSPSSLNLFCVSPALYVLQKFYSERTPMGAAAHRGTAVEYGLVAALNGYDADTAGAKAVEKYVGLTGLTTDPKRESMQETIPNMVEMAYQELERYGPQLITQGKIEWHPPELASPIMGYYDFHWPEENITVDLKTSDKMPSAVKIPHARQVSFYAGGGNSDARITYVTPKKCQTYRVENVDFHRNALKNIALRAEKFLAISDDPAELLMITAPDLENFYWHSDVARALAYKYWGI